MRNIDADRVPGTACTPALVLPTGGRTRVARATQRRGSHTADP